MEEKSSGHAKISARHRWLLKITNKKSVEVWFVVKKEKKVDDNDLCSYRTNTLSTRRMWNVAISWYHMPAKRKIVYISQWIPKEVARVNQILCDCVCMYVMYFCIILRLLNVQIFNDKFLAWFKFTESLSVGQIPKILTINSHHFQLFFV